MSSDKLNMNELAEQLLNTAVNEGSKGVRDLYEQVSNDLPEIERHALAIQFSELIWAIAGARTALIDLLGPAIQAAGDQDNYYLILRGMAVSLRIQMEEGNLNEIPDNVSAMEQVAKWANSHFYLYLARVFAARLLLAQAKFNQAITQLESLIPTLDEVQEIDNQQVVLREILENLALAYKSTGQYRLLNDRLNKLQELTQDSSIQAHLRGIVAQAEGNTTEAIRHYNKAVQLGVNELDKRWSLESLVNLGILERDKTQSHLEDAKDLAQKIGDEAALLRVQFATLRSEFDAGRYQEARELATALSETKDPNIMALSAEVFAVAGPVEKARPIIRELLDIADNCQIKGLLAHANVLAATIAQTNLERIDHAEQGAKLYQENEDKVGLGRALAQLAFGELERNAPEKADSIARQVLSIAVVSRHPDLESLAEMVIGLAAQLLKNDEEAEIHLKRSLHLAQQYNLVSLEVNALNALGDPEQASALIEQHGGLRR